MSDDMEYGTLISPVEVHPDRVPKVENWAPSSWEVIDARTNARGTTYFTLNVRTKGVDATVTVIRSKHGPLSCGTCKHARCRHLVVARRYLDGGKAA